MKLAKMLIFLNCDQDSDHYSNLISKTMTQTQTHKKVTLVFRSNLPQKMQEAMGIGDGDGVYGWNVPPEDETGAPPPYIPKAAFERGTQKSLKQSQVSKYIQVGLPERDTPSLKRSEYSSPFFTSKER